MAERSIQVRHPGRGGRGLLIAAVAAVAVLVCAASASAKTWKVTTTSDTTSGSCHPSSCSLRQAIAAAANGDTIVLPASKSPYRVTNGQLVVEEESVTIEGAGAKSTVIKGETAGNGVLQVIGNTGPVTLKALTITGGNTTGNSISGGGGIEAYGPGPLVLDHVDVTGNLVNTTAVGSGFDAFNLGGGGIYSTTSVVLIGSRVSHNTVTVPKSDGDSGGGGILIAEVGDNSDDLTLIDSTVSHNTAAVAPDGTGATDANGGGGIYMDGGNLTIRSSLIQDNTADVSRATPNTSTPTDGGGGIFQFGNQFLLEDSTVSGNVAHGPGVARGGGGGILDSGNGSRYLNSTVVDNSTNEPAATSDQSDGGGGILLNNVEDGVIMANMTIDRNSAAPGLGGGVNVIADNATTLEIADSILAENTAAAPDDNCAGSVYSLGYNLTSDKSTNNTCAFGGPGNIFGVNPRLGKLARHGGPTPTQPLRSGSRAINHGNPAGCTDLLGDLLRTDQRGVARPAAGHGRCDIGAYEVAKPALSARAARDITATSVKLVARVNAEGKKTRYRLEYGPASSRGYRARTRTRTLPARLRGVTVRIVLNGLQSGTTYRCRLVAENVAGRTSGPVVYFTTRSQ